MKSLSYCLTFLAAGALLLSGTAAQAVLIDWVTVGNPGNAGDTETMHDGSTGYGSVGYTYQISKYDTTNNQYTEFLNAKAATNGDVLALYNTEMSSDARGGITRTGSGTGGDPYIYSVKSSQGNNPVTWVSFFDSLRFANWLHNGQGSGDTETGAYTLLGGTPTPSNFTVTRNPGAQVFLTSEDEWYKAAYHKNDGVTGNYWDYPTSTDAEPYSDQPPGSDAPTQSNTANFDKHDEIANGYDDGYAVTGSPSFVNAQNYLTDVGAYTLSTSPYGTFDQGGNVYEWNERLFDPFRGLRGGSWFDGSDQQRASDFITLNPAVEIAFIGFRVASPFSEAAAVPEPGTLVLGLIGAVVLVMLRRRRTLKTPGC